MNVLIIDDDKLVAISLKNILMASGDIHVIGIGHDGQSACSLYASLKPDVLLMDIRMQGMSGLDAGALILAKHPEAKILFLTTFSDDEYIIKALSIGAKGYLLKQDFESIAPSLLAVEKGQTVFGGEVIGKLPGLIHSESNLISFREFNITDKESEIIEAVAKGLNNKEIADELFLSEGTVRNYLSIILEKLNLRDRTQLAIWYFRQQK